VNVEKEYTLHQQHGESLKTKKHIFIMMYHDDEADVVSRVQAGQPRCCSLISIRGQEIFYFPSISNLALKSTQSATQWLPRGALCLGERQLRNEADYSLPDTNLKMCETYFHSNIYLHCMHTDNSFFGIFITT
jgi:hypothetical protein